MDLRVLTVGFLLLLAVGAGAKTGRNYYTDERLGWMRENIRTHDWAKQARDRVLATADRWAAYDDERLQHLVPPLQVPRCGTVHAGGCPVHGEEILKHPGGRKSWRMSFDKPYKIQCPVDGEWYPSNDFWAYLQGGCEDESLLAGEYVDDGWGYKAPEVEKKFWFVGYYAGEMTRRWLLPAIESLSEAYLITEDSTYAHKAGLLLWKLSQYYPDYLYEKQSRYALEFMPWYNGRLQYHTWECFTIHTVSLAYDAVWPAIIADEALAELAGTDGPGVCRDIEDRMLRVAAGDITDGSHRIAGNYGMHQSALLRIALVLDTEEGEQTSQDMIDWVLEGPEKVSLYTDTPLPDAMVNLLHRDGVPFESPSYNCGWMTQLEDVAELLLMNGVDVWSVPRFRGLYQWPMKMLVCGTMTQPMGDSNNMFAGGLGITPKYLERAFQRMGDPRQAKAMVQNQSPFRRDLFQRSMEQPAREVAAQIPEPVGVTSELLPGLGYATLQAGEATNRTAIALHYGYHTAHRHFDTLNLEVYAHNQALIPDLGYPETADTFDPRRHGWLAHNIVHNTVMVDATRQQLAFGQPVAFHPEGWAQLAEARSPGTYEGVVSDYRRACFLIEVDEANAYCLDIFRVVGGGQHDWVIHGTEAELSVEDIALSEPREEGTLAGPDVPYGKFYDDPKLIEGRPGTRYHTYKGSAFQWLTNVQEAGLDGIATVTWRLTRDPELYPSRPTAGIGLRVHMLGDEETLFVCDGIPQRRPNFPGVLKWVVRRKQGDDLSSNFVSVFEPFGGDAPYIRGVRAIPVSPDDGSVAVQISLDGQRHFAFWTPEPDVPHTFAGYSVQGRAACVRQDAGGRAVAMRLFDGTLLTDHQARLAAAEPPAARIARLDYGANLVTLDADVLEEGMVGRWTPVDTGTHVTAVRIDKIIDKTTFSLGDQDLRCAVAGVLDIDEDGTVKHDRVTYFTWGGMTVLDEAGKAVGKLASRALSEFRLEGPAPTLEQFPDVDGDGKRKFTVMAVGQGDRVRIGNSLEWES